MAKNKRDRLNELVAQAAERRLSPREYTPIVREALRLTSRRDFNLRVERARRRLAIA